MFKGLKLFSRRKRRLIDTYVTKIAPAPEESRPSNVMMKASQQATCIKKAENKVAASVG